MSTGNYFRESGEQAHRFREPCHKIKNRFKKSHFKGKASILLDFLKQIFGFWRLPPDPPPLNVIVYFTCTSGLMVEKKYAE